MTTSLAAVREERDTLAADILETETSKDLIITKACSKRSVTPLLPTAEIS